MENEAIDNLYNIIAIREDYVNPMTDGELSWRSICFYDDEALDRCQNRLHEVSSRHYAHVTKYERWIRKEVFDPPKFDGIGLIIEFLE